MWFSRLSAVFLVLCTNFWCATGQCNSDQDFRIQFDTSPSAFVVSQNGTCACPGSGFVGDGRRLDLDQNPSVQALSTLVNTAQQSFSALQTSVTTMQQTVATQLATVQNVAADQGAATPVSRLASQQQRSSCRAVKTATPSSTSGLYFLLNPSGSTYQFYCDMSTDGGGWTLVWKAPALELNDPAIKYFIGSKPIIADAYDMMFAYADASNVLTQAWKFPVPPPFIDATPMGIDYCNYNLINATRISDGFKTTQILRAGNANFGHYCDDGCFAPGMIPGYTAGSYYGQICLKSTSAIPCPYLSATVGFSDFPHFSGFAYASSSDLCVRSDENYGVTSCSSSRLFAIFVR